jgi:hypothetical protein
MKGLPPKRELQWHIRAELENSGEVVPRTQYQIIFASVVIFIVMFFPSVYGLEALLRLLVYDIQNQVPIETSFIPMIFVPLSMFSVLLALFLIIRLPWVVFPARAMIEEKLKDLTAQAKILDGKFLEMATERSSTGEMRYKLRVEVVFENGAIIQANYTTGSKVDVKSDEQIKLLFLTRGLIVPMIF